MLRQQVFSLGSVRTTLVAGARKLRTDGVLRWRFWTACHAGTLIILLSFCWHNFAAEADALGSLRGWGEG